MSTRPFARLYAEETGYTPAKAVESMRVEAACRLLIQTKDKLTKIANECGFMDFALILDLPGGSSRRVADVL